MYGLFSDDEEKGNDLTKNSKGVLVPYKSTVQSGPRYGGRLVQSIVYCPTCRKAQGITHSTEPPYFLQVPQGVCPEFVITKEGNFKHQLCNYSILKKEISKNGKGN